MLHLYFLLFTRIHMAIFACKRTLQSKCLFIGLPRAWEPFLSFFLFFFSLPEAPGVAMQADHKARKHRGHTSMTSAELPTLPSLSLILGCETPF
ncbi:hypothetical protein I7I50_09353 [Histoplasma capsulatum G186AR]|uniref:Uncharacterized protein n=1 Tax=Ajellomyces capsulatus TaxID=5037 RepID=A0A8H7YS37_AJECA|nr:hypothetical protein I7I52_06874 [Histoplasma capsulatum]QSS74253.1 hypothetical protein I7I50_09353 [Histoplasma capsulatum G186AR]